MKLYGPGVTCETRLVLCILYDPTHIVRPHVVLL
jgi:hypothetical protein